MQLPRLPLSTAAVAVIAAIASTDAFSCASCGCTLSSEWDNVDFVGTAGVKLDVRYDYLNQDQLRSGTDTISAVDASRHLNRGDPQEVEKYTKNDYLTVGLDYTFNREWAINLQVPYIDRSHSTLGTASDGVTAGPGGGQYKSSISDLGDIKLVGRYQGFSVSNLGVLFGVKLPTGSHTRSGTSIDPTAPDPVPIDRGLQPGTGTTDAILGVYYADNLNKNWSYFAQGLFQRAFNSKDQYKPGDGINVNIGLRYQGFAAITPQFQLNARHIERDSGANADIFSTGGTLLYLSPGISVPINKQASIYGFVQVPLYQDFNGVQLAPRYTASLGARFSF
ncbi:MAG TPA: hypothetical protein VGK97_05110 [Spongiibacteraceae bacterium]